MERDWTKTVGALEIAKGEASNAMKRAEEAEEKAKQDVKMAIRRYRRTKAFRREADANYLARLNECRAKIMKANLGVDFSFITSVTKTQLNPNFQAVGEDVISPLIPLDDEYEATIDIEESKKRCRVEEEGEEVEQLMGETSEIPLGGEATRLAMRARPGLFSIFAFVFIIIVCF